MSLVASNDDSLDSSTNTLVIAAIQASTDLTSSASFTTAFMSIKFKGSFYWKGLGCGLALFGVPFSFFRATPLLGFLVPCNGFLFWSFPSAYCCGILKDMPHYLSLKVLLNERLMYPFG